MIKCATCQLDKPTSSYTKDKHRKNRLRASCKACRVEERKQWYLKNKDSSSKRCAAYYQTNKTKIKAYIAKSQKDRRHKDINYRILCNLRRRLHRSVSGKIKAASAQSLLGCSIPFLKEFLLSKFKPGMTWDNYGKWHIDHIIPCARFDMSDPKQQQACFHYSNLQPLWAIENLKKSCAII